MDITRIGDRMMAVQSMGDCTHAERTVLSCIAWHDGKNGAFPSIETLCAEAGGMSPARMRNLLRSLEKDAAAYQAPAKVRWTVEHLHRRVWRAVSLNTRKPCIVD